MHGDGSQNRRRHWLCIAYAFPPINRSGTHRTLGFVRELDRKGWDASVITVDPRRDPVDESLLRFVPRSTTVVRTRWLDLHTWAGRLVGRRRIIEQDVHGHARIPAHGASYAAGHAPNRTTAGRVCDWLSRWLVTPDTRIGWIPFAVCAGMRAIRRRRPDVIFSTSPYASAHLAALLLSRRTRIPWVADFRDPWRGNPFRNDPTGLHNRLDEFLEKTVMQHATRVVCCTDTMRRAFSARRPSLTEKGTTIMNAFDEERCADIKPMRSPSTSPFLITHAGQFYGSRSPLPWFRALQCAAEHRPSLRDQLRMVLIGDEAYNGRPLTDWAAAMDVADMVKVLGRLGHAETLSHLAGSDALMLCGACGPGSDLQVPNKLFEYLALRKPIIVSCCATSPIVDILREAKGVALIRHPNDVTGLADALYRLVTHRSTIPRNAWAGVEQFERAYRANELAELFAQVTHDRWTAAEIIKQKSIPLSPDLIPPAIIPKTPVSESGDAWSTTSPHTSG